jgi:hypothetical protein
VTLSGLFLARGLVIGLAVIDLLFGAWFTGSLISDRPTNPVGLFVVPFEQHGGVSFISASDLWLHRSLWIGAFVLVGVYNLIEFAIKRRRLRTQR